MDTYKFKTGMGKSTSLRFKSTPAAQIFCLERATIVRVQGASEDKKFTQLKSSENRQKL
jgi:hypothetical protein